MHHETKSATQLLISAKLSARMSAAVCQQIYKNETNIETSTQYDIYRAIFKEAAKFNEVQKDAQFLECLYLDGKHIDNKYYYIIV